MGNLYIGTQKPKGIYVGSKKVQSVYLGTQKVWAANTSRLPADTAYIRLTVAFNDADSIYITKEKH